MKKPGKGDIVFDIVNTCFMLFLVIITIYPVWHILAASLSQADELMKHRGALLFPVGKTSLEAYKAVLIKDPMIATSYKNTLIYVVLGTFISLVLTTLGAYGLSRKKARLAGPIMFLITFTMLFNGGLIPTFLWVRDLKMVDTIWAVIIPNAVSVYNLIILRTSFMAIPDSLEEAARIDGANDFVILSKIVLPLSKAVMSVMVLFYSVAIWNAWFWAMVYLRNRELYPLQLILRELLITNSTDSMTTGVSASDTKAVGVTIQYAAIIVSVIPVMLIYPFIQKYFVKGVMIGAIKS